MINLIVGENSSGKTVYLEKLLKEKYKYGVSTNMLKIDPKIESVGFNQERVNILDEITICDGINSTGQYLEFTGKKETYSLEFIKLLSLICKDNSILILDEPDLMIEDTEGSRLAYFMSRVGHTFNEVYIVTHDELMLSIPDAKYWTVDKNMDAYEISEDEAYEFID
jgi:hypothetical protein